MLLPYMSIYIYIIYIILYIYVCVSAMWQSVIGGHHGFRQRPQVALAHGGIRGGIRTRRMTILMV